jgi:hypothetical protein
MHAIAFVLLKLTLWEVVTDIPHDFAAIVTYTVLALFVAGIWYGSRAKGMSTAGPSGQTEDQL